MTMYYILFYYKSIANCTQDCGQTFSFVLLVDIFLLPLGAIGRSSFAPLVPFLDLALFKNITRYHSVCSHTPFVEPATHHYVLKIALLITWQKKTVIIKRIMTEQNMAEKRNGLNGYVQKIPIHAHAVCQIHLCELMHKTFSLCPWCLNLVLCGYDATYCGPKQTCSQLTFSWLCALPGGRSAVESVKVWYSTTIDRLIRRLLSVRIAWHICTKWFNETPWTAVRCHSFNHVTVESNLRLSKNERMFM